MEMLLRRMNAGDITVHGFRSAFRDWCGEATNYPREVAEAALAHSVGDAVERAPLPLAAAAAASRASATWCRCAGQQAECGVR